MTRWRGAAFTCVGIGSFTFSCSDAYGNTGGDWTDCAAGQEGVNGNFSANPLFCGPTDYRLNSASPCVAPQLPAECGDLVGAIGVGCGTSAVAERPAVPARWGEVKARIVARP